MLTTALFYVPSSLWDLGFYLAQAFFMAKVKEQWWNQAIALKTSACKAFISIHILVAN